jgi:hypothetical protein
LSEEQEERTEREIDNNDDFKEPVEIVREEVVEVVENPTAETFPLSSETQHEEEEDHRQEIKANNINRDIYEQVKAQSIQLSSLVELVESLQFQVQQLQETIRLGKRHKTTSIRKKSTSNKSTKTKKKTNIRGSATSRKK